LRDRPARRRGIESAAGKLMGVLVIVLPDAEDIAPRPRDRRLEGEARGRDGGTEARRVGAQAALDDREPAQRLRLGAEIEGTDAFAVGAELTDAQAPTRSECGDPHFCSQLL